MATNPRIRVYPAGNCLSDRQSVLRVPFDVVSFWVQPSTAAEALGDRGHWREECWVRYRCGRLFARRIASPIVAGEVTHEWGAWQSFRFEPKDGNAYMTGWRRAEEWQRVHDGVAL